MPAVADGSGEAPLDNLDCLGVSPDSTRWWSSTMRTPQSWRSSTPTGRSSSVFDACYKYGVDAKVHHNPRR